MAKSLVVGKYFRLLDFHVYDSNPKDSISDSSSESSKSGSSNGYVPYSNYHFTIQMFGLNESGETCCLYIDDYKPFFYIKVGDDWKSSRAQELLLYFKSQQSLKYVSSAIESVKLVEYNKLYGFSAGKNFKFVLITFTNLQAMNKVKNLWYSYDKESGERKRKNLIFMGQHLELYESNIPPLLRYFHINNISPSGWVLVKTNKCASPTVKTTTCTYEYICSLKNVVPAVDREMRVPYKICSFDIEASSSHGDFPLPIKSYKRLACNIIDIFQKQDSVISGDKERAEKLLTKIIMTSFGYDRFDDVDIVYPMNQPTKEKVKKLIQDLLMRHLSDIEHKICSANNIESLFEKMNQQPVISFDNDDSDDDMEDIEEETKPIYKKYIKKTKIEKKSTIIDVLLDPNYNREEKVQLINKTLYNDDEKSCKTNFPKLKGDEVTFIGSTFLRYGETVPYLNHCLVVGSCDPVDGAVIESVDDETDLLTAWTRLIQEENPDIIIGYNIFGFDYEFMFHRAQELHCEREFFPLSRKIGELSVNETQDKETYEKKYDLENTKIAIASGEYDLRFFKMTGRLQIDMLAYFRRDFNLSSYKLDDVAGQFISDDVKKIDYTEDGNTRLFSSNLAGLNIGDFIHIEITGFSADYYNNGQKFKVLDIERGVEDKYNVITIKGRHAIKEAAGDKYVKWGMAKDDVTPQDIFRLSKGSAADRAIVAKYCIQDCNLVHHLMNKIDVITGYVEMSRICSVPISFLVFRGQGVKLTSYVAKKCREKNTLMPDLEKEKGGDGYEGAIVLPPKCDIYMDNPVACVDYSSLYPSGMISQNYSHDSKVWTKEFDLEGNLISETGEKDKAGNYIYEGIPGYEYIQVEFDTYKYLRNPERPKSREVKTKVGKKICCWAQLPENQKSIMPSILEELLKARSDTRKMIKTEKDPFMQNILDKRQLGYKVTANSLYGQCGARTSTFYEKDVAASTTATGRMMITYAKRIIEEVYGDLVYETAIHGAVKCKAQYVYGDSVANYTPVKIRKNGGNVIICSIETLAKRYGNDIWVKCQEPGKETKEYCELKNIESWTEQGWTKLYRVIRHGLHTDKKMYRVQTYKGLVDVTDDHSLLKPDGIEISPKDCVIGTPLLHHNLPAFQQIEISYDYLQIHNTNKFIAEDQVYLATIADIMMDYKITESHNMIYLEKIDKDDYVHNEENPYTIRSMREIQYNHPYVYDLTTENHHFAAGVGSLIVHNTDSVFFNLNLENPETGEKVRGKPALEMTIEIAQDVANLCTSYLKPPMALTYEKTLMPFILLSKKRYVGMLYEEDPNKGKLKYMGLVLKRRDNCDLVKDIYGGVLNILMKETETIQSAVDFLHKSLNELIDGKVPMDKLMITKALRSDYKNPQQIAHRVLADRMGKRDPGNKPKPGDRIKYVYIVNPDKKALQGDKIENPEFIIDNKIPIDYTHYITNQLMKPLQQLFGLALTQIWESQKKQQLIRAYKKEMATLEKENPDLEVFMKKKEKYCSKKIKEILFDKFLQKIFNAQNGIRTLDEMFGKKK